MRTTYRRYAGIDLVFAQEEPPDHYESLIFLVGPTPRDPSVPSWRPQAVLDLFGAGYRGVVVIPEPRPGTTFDPERWEQQTLWETTWLDRADVIMAWVPRDMATMPGLTTNFEIGERLDSGRLVLGAPEGAASVRYLIRRAERAGVPVCPDLIELADVVARRTGGGVVRVGAQRCFPADVWKMPGVQAWYRSMVDAGDRLVDAKVTYRIGRFLAAIHVEVHVGEEGRVKANETIIVRPDISAVLVYRPRPDPLDTEFVIVKEFRSPGRTDDGFVRELPGGSDRGDPVQVAATELREEAGLDLAPARLRHVASRQLAATITTHVAHLYAVELTDTEWDMFVGAQDGRPNRTGTEEITYVEIRTVRDLLDDQDIDWTNVGMILSAITKESA